MSMIRFREVDSLNKVYEDILKSIDTGKNIKAGGALVTFPDKERNICELSATYIVRTGRFSKEQRVLVVLPFKKDSDGTYAANIEESVFHVVQDDKGSLKEVWKGQLKEAMEKLGDVAQIHINVISTVVGRSLIR
ncbi:MAG: hypothetical protein QXF52_02285 [Thermoproteota archaeon]